VTEVAEQIRAAFAHRIGIGIDDLLPQVAIA
jgi:hypothetical protein